MKIDKKVWIGIAVVASLAVFGLLASQGGTQTETVRVKQGTITRYVEDTGYVQAARSYDLYASQSGRIVQRAVETGQIIKEGQTLLVIENLDLAQQVGDARSGQSQARSSVAAARAALRKGELDLKDARENLKRSRQLLETGSISETDYETAALSYDSYSQVYDQLSAELARAVALELGSGRTLEQLQSKAAQLTVKSPVNGEVLSLPVEKEDYVSPGTLLVRVAVPDLMEIKADILSDDLAEVKLGQKVIITSPVLGEKQLIGTVKKIYPQAEEKQSALGIIQRRVPVIISVSNTDNLRPGYEVRVAIQTNQRQNVLVLPRESVRTAADGSKEVLLVADDRVSHKTVQTGLGDNDNIEITGGLKGRDIVVKDASLDLAENTRIKSVSSN